MQERLICVKAVHVRAVHARVVCVIAVDLQSALKARHTIFYSAPHPAISMNRTLQWTLANPNSLIGTKISEIFALVKATASTCVIVSAPYLHSVLGSLGGYHDFKYSEPLR